MNTLLTLRNGKVRENLNTNHALRPCTNEYSILTFFLFATHMHILHRKKIKL